MSTLDVLCYHAVTDDDPPLDDFCFLHVDRFEAQMRWLRKLNIDLLPLKLAVPALMEGKLRRRAVAITFDDGFRNNLAVAMPVLQKYGIPATIYLATGFVGSPSTTWSARITRALVKTSASSVEFRGKTLSIISAQDRRGANCELQRLVKKFAGGDPNAAAAEIERQLEVSEDPDVSGDPHFSMIRREDLPRALASNLIDFGAHSVSHPILSALDDDRHAFEINQSIDDVEALTGERCYSFAFPNGQPSDFDKRTLSILRKRGVPYALTTSQAANNALSDPLRLSRWVLGNNTSLMWLRAAFWGLHPDSLSARLERLRVSRSS